MIGLQEDLKAARINEMLEQMESIYTDLRFEYTEMAKSYDDAVVRIEELEADKLYLEDLLEETRQAGVYL